MAKIGQLERVVFQAKNFQTGLTDIVAFVTKPDASVVGPYSLIEMTDPNFEGCYYFDLPTVDGDPYGSYIGVVNSPSQNLKTPFKLVYEVVTVQELEDVANEMIEAIKLFRPTDIEVEFIDLDDSIIEVEIIDN